MHWERTHKSPRGRLYAYDWRNSCRAAASRDARRRLFCVPLERANDGSVYLCGRVRRGPGLLSRGARSKHRGGPLRQSDDVERFPHSFFSPAKFSDTRFAPRDLLRSSRFPRIDLTSGALTIRRLAIRRVLIESAEFKSLEIQPLTVTRFRAAEITTSDSLKPPRSNVDRDISRSRRHQVEL